MLEIPNLCQFNLPHMIFKTLKWGIAWSLSLSLFCTSTVSAQKLNGKPIDPVDLVNPLMGTDSKPSLSNGNTYPAIGLPWGMNMWTPQTGKNGDGWQYKRIETNASTFSLDE